MFRVLITLHYWKSVQRCHIKPNAKSLKRHALNILDGAKENMREMERLTIQYRLSSDQILFYFLYKSQRIHELTIAHPRVESSNKRSLS